MPRKRILYRSYAKYLLKILVDNKKTNTHIFHMLVEYTKIGYKKKVEHTYSMYMDQLFYGVHSSFPMSEKYEPATEYILDYEDFIKPLIREHKMKKVLHSI